jgi:hypothetical protein
MSGVIKIEITETVDELKELLKLTEHQGVKERVQALYWLKSDQLVRYRLGGKLKVPRPVHTKQKLGAVDNFKKN